MPSGPQTIEVRVGETRVKRFSPPVPTSVSGMTFKLLLRRKGEDAVARVRTSGNGLAITTLTGDVDWTIDTTDTAEEAVWEWELERTSSGAEIDVAWGYLVVVEGMVAP